MSSERQTKYGRSSYRLVREQRMLAKRKEQRGKSKEERAKRKEQRGKSKEERAKRKAENGKVKALSNNSSTRLLVYSST